MTSSTSSASTTRPNAWRQRKRQSKRHFVTVQMQAKHTSHARKIFIEETSTTKVLSLNWKLRAGPYGIILNYSSWKVTSQGVRGAGKRPYKISSKRQIWIRAMF